MLSMKMSISCTATIIIVVAHAFGRLKSLCCILIHLIWNLDVKLILKLICLCYILHNILLQHVDIVNDILFYHGHHNKGQCKQISQCVEVEKVEIIQEINMEHSVLV
jgi:hypothetical protein